MTAGDVRHGRQGGRALAASDRPGVCAVCHTGDARWLTTHWYRAETWAVCNTCRDQARRYSVPVSHAPLTRVTCPRCGHTTLVTHLPARCPHCHHQTDGGAA